MGSPGGRREGRREKREGRPRPPQDVTQAVCRESFAQLPDWKTELGVGVGAWGAQGCLREGIPGLEGAAASALGAL